MLADPLTSMDAGGYYFFSYLLSQHPAFRLPMLAGDLLGSYVGAGVLIVLAVFLLVRQQRWRAAQVAGGVFALGVIIAEVMRSLVGGNRPMDADKLVEQAEMLRSFPAREVLTFTLAGALLILASWSAVAGRRLCTLLAIGIVVLILWVAMSQLALGLHYVSDVLAGLAAAVALAAFASRYFATREKSVYA